jgi:hypothetical protein
MKELKRKIGSSFSETPTKDPKPAKESKIGPATQWTKHAAAISIPARSPVAARSFILGRRYHLAVKQT